MAKQSPKLLILLLLCSALAGCSSLLPRGSSATPSPFADFEQARAAAEKIAAFRTSTSDLAALDPGVRACIEAQAACQAYLFHFEQQIRRREGGFWMDFLNVRRVTQVTGWWFDLLVVVNGQTILFRNVAGQAHTDRVERQSNPLGPLQGAGESVGAILIR